MQIEIKINGQAAELQEVLRALLNTTVTPTTEANSIDLRKPSAAPKATKAPPTNAPAPTKAAPTPIEPTPIEPTPIEPTPAPIEPTPAPIAAAPSISFEEFRKAVGAAALINKEAVRAALQKYGAAKTSEVKSEEYAAIMDDLKAIK